jgi:predicted negative regulator of RcsB-dependent stress response
VVLVVAGVWYFRNSQHSARQQALGDAITLTSAAVGQAPPTGGPSFPTEAAKNEAVAKAFTKTMSDYSGTDEGYIAEYYLAAQAADLGKMDDARRRYQDVADHASANYASIAKLAIAQIDFAENRGSEAETILKDLMEHPTDMVSKTQAAVVYARGIAAARPDEARKLLQPLVGDSTETATIVNAVLAELPPATK